MRVPEILNIPPKLKPMITDFDRYRYFLLEGGRGSAKTHSTARFLLYLADNYTIRVVCGREFQNSIEESVYTVLKDLVDQYNLNFEVTAKKIIHRVTGSAFTFKGFRDQSKVNIKGLEGVDILWIDEAQSVTKNTLDIIVPTIRKDNAKLMFTMNRFMDDDAVPNFLEARADCLHIHIDYFDNPFCPLSLKIEAEELRLRSEREYNHIYLGIPLTAADDILFDFSKLKKAQELVPFGETSWKSRVIGIDFAAQGNDQCVATILDRVSNQHWRVAEQIAWDEPDGMASVGKIIDIIGKHKPTASILDVGGMGHIVHNRLREVGIPIERFDGASTLGIDTKIYRNIRAAAYYETKIWVDNEFLCIPPENGDMIQEAKKIRFKFNSNGSRQIIPKEETKKDLGRSPDRIDSLMMAVWCAKHYNGNDALGEATPSSGMVRRSNPRRAARR